MSRIISSLLICLYFHSQLLASEIIPFEDKNSYKPYECEHFKVGDAVTYSFYWVGFDSSDFIGVVAKIEPKPTNEYMHLITVKKISGEKGESGIYSEKYLEKLQTAEPGGVSSFSPPL